MFRGECVASVDEGAQVGVCVCEVEFELMCLWCGCGVASGNVEEVVGGYHVFTMEFSGMFATVYGDGSCFAGFEVDCETIVGEVVVDGGGVFCDCVGKGSVVVSVNKEGNVVNPY